MKPCPQRLIFFTSRFIASVGPFEAPVRARTNDDEPSAMGNLRGRSKIPGYPFRTALEGSPSFTDVSPPQGFGTEAPTFAHVAA